MQDLIISKGDCGRLINSTKKDGLKKIIGLRKDVTNGKEWKYILFYDLDNPSEKDVEILRDMFEQFKISYIIYKTKHGIHAVGLSPLYSDEWGIKFTQLQFAVPEYYSGMIIRISLKEGEKQELLYYNLDYPCISNLLNIYDQRFNYVMHVMTQLPTFTQDRWNLVFEKYWSKKQ